MRSSAHGTLHQLRCIIPSMQSPAERGCRVLCVDDNESAVRVRAAVLEVHGYSVATLTNENDVLDHLAMHPADAVVLDYLMPDLRGDQLATIIREHHPEIPILLISGAVDEPDEMGGADAFITKSAGPRRLLEVLAEQIQRREKPGKRVA
jgi:two-component system, cell cycle sensor histidine kinase and response regulator CckA